MSHHVSAGPTNPTGAVEVVRVSSSASTTAPVDNGTSAPVSTVSTGAPPAAGSSGTPGANLPVDGIQQASNTIQGARADLTRTTGAERRLDGFDGVGGGGGGGGAANNAGQQNANNATGAAAQGTANLNTSDQQNGTGADRVNGQQILDPASANETQSTVTGA
jgi:hypothetical protein